MTPQEMIRDCRESALAYARKFFKGNWPDADDAYQEACIKAFRSYDPARTYVAGWFMEIVKNVCVDLKRKAKSRPTVGLPDKEALENLIAVCDSDPTENETRTEQKVKLKKMMERLTPAEKKILEAKQDGLTHREIAAHMNISEVNARQRLFRAMNALKGVSESG